MDSQVSRDIETKLRTEENGVLKIRTTIKMQHNSFVALESEWKKDNEMNLFKRIESRIIIDELSVSHLHIPVPLAHIHLIEDQLQERLGSISLDASSTEFPSEISRVYLARRFDGVGVFLDAISAAFWAGTIKEVKEVSVAGAALALKTDRESVVESAIAASKRAWESIRVILAILAVANELRARVRKMGLLIEELQNQDPFSHE